MKAIFITIFLNYELFLCKTVHKKTLNETFLTRNLHRSLIEIDSLLRGVQKEIQKERKIIKTQLDYEHAIIPEDSNVLGYDVTDLFWGETGVEGVTHEDVTSTFLPTPPTPPPTEEDYGEAYEEDTEPPIPPPPPTTTMEINTNYPGYPYEPPPFNPIGYEPENTPTPRNDSFDFLLTPPIFDTTTRSPYDEVIGLPTTPTPVDIDTPPPTPIPDYSFTTIKYTFDLPSPPGPETQTRQKIRMNSYDFAVTPPDFGKLTRSLIDDFNKYFGFMFQNNNPSKLSTLARKPYNAPLKTPLPPKTTRRLSKYLMRNDQKLNLMSHVSPASEKYMQFENRFRHVATTPVQWWTAKKSVRARVPLMPAASSLSKSQWWVKQHMKNSAPVHREGGLTPQEEPVSPPSQPDHKTAATTTETTRLTARTGVFDSFGIPQYNPLTSTSLSTAASFNDTRLIFGDIGIKKSTKAPTERRVYLKMMEELNEGYLPIFLLEIFRITSLKDEKPVKQLLEEVELHVNTWFGPNRSFGEPLTTFLTEISRLLSVAQVDFVRSYSSMLYHLLQTRKSTLSVEVNSIIDYADLLYNAEESGELLDAIIEYEKFPNGNKKAKEACEFILDSFIKPYTRLSRSERRQTLIDSVNYALKSRFPLRSNFFDHLIPQTTHAPNAISNKLSHKLHKYKRKRKRKKTGGAGDVIKHFSSRLNNIKSLKQTTKRDRDLITPVINNYMFDANKRKEVGDKYYNNDDKTKVNNKNAIYGTSDEDYKDKLDRNKKEKAVFNNFHDVRSYKEKPDLIKTKKKAVFKDFDNTKDAIADLYEYSLKDSEEIKEMLKKAENKLKETADRYDDEASRGNIDDVNKRCDDDRMKVLKSYARILNDDDDTHGVMPGKKSDSDASIQSYVYS